MRILLDTHVFLWVVADSRSLRREARAMIAAAEQVFVSAASIWEVAIKARIGKIDADPALLAEAVTASGFDELPVRAAHAARVATLELHHADPFDRLLIAQAQTEPLRLLTANAALVPYSDLVTLV